MAGPTFRTFQADDTSRVIEVFRTRAGTFFDVSEEAELEAYLETLATPEDYAERIEFWTMWLDEKLVGFGGAEVLNACGYLCWGTVDAASGGRGLGRALLAHRLRAIKTLGAGSAFSDTTPLAEGFYAKHGFHVFHRAPRYWGGSLDLAAMELSFDGQLRGPSRVDADGKLRYQPIA